MSQTPPSGSQPEQGQGQQAAAPAGAASVAAPVVLPWYARPWPWAWLLLLLLLLYGGWLIWLQWQGHKVSKEQQEALLQEQLGRNAQREAEAARLREALNADPCVAAEILRSSRAGLSPLPAQNAAPSAEAAPTKDSAQAEQTPPPAAPATATTPAGKPESLPQLLEQATVLILTDGPEGVQMGTGFFIAPGIVLTNQHVVGNGKGDIIVVGTFQGTVAEATPVVISKAKGRDYAVLKVPVTSVTPLAISTTVSRTQKVSAWGFPGAVTNDDPKFQALLKGQSVAPPEVVYSEGAVSVVLDRKPPLIVHTAVVSQGNSGGPLVNDQGQVVGINTYIRLDDESYRQSSLAIVGKDVLAFLKENNIPFTLAPTTPAAPGTPPGPSKAGAKE